jgi:hypothetical protein
MHPRVFLESFWRADLRDEVFVAMSFDSKFDRTWRNIFVPAIEDHPISGKTLRAIRPDVRKSGDSILSEIIDGIAHSQLFLVLTCITI